MRPEARVAFLDDPLPAVRSRCGGCRAEAHFCLGAGCECECRAGDAVSEPQAESRLPQRQRAQREAARLRVFCWCGARAKAVPVELIAQRRTFSCGAPSCRPGAEPIFGDAGLSGRGERVLGSGGNTRELRCPGSGLAATQRRGDRAPCPRCGRLVGIANGGGLALHLPKQDDRGERAGVA